MQVKIKGRSDFHPGRLLQMVSDTAAPRSGVAVMNAPTTWRCASLGHTPAEIGSTVMRLSDTVHAGLKDTMRLVGCWSFTADRRQRSARGFSFTDLVALLGVLTLLVLVQLPALAHNKSSSHRAVCADNLRRLAMSWLMYADDNRGRLAPNLGVAETNFTNNWVGGILGTGLATLASDNTNLAAITQAKLYPYDNSVEIYRCPDDTSTYQGQLRIRSYSMNGWVGNGTYQWNSGFQLMTLRSQIRQPDQTFVFTEEHQDSINDGLIIAVIPPFRLADIPAGYHNYGANLSFADGSVHYRHWLDPRTSPISPIFGQDMPNNPDVIWLRNISTYAK